MATKPKKDYYGIEAIFYFPYTKSTPKYKQVDNERKRKIEEARKERRLMNLKQAS